MIHWSTVEGSHRSFKPTHGADQSLPQLVFQSCDWGWIAAIQGYHQLSLVKDISGQCSDIWGKLWIKVSIEAVAFLQTVKWGIKFP